jgi:hypothetical protein
MSGGGGGGAQELKKARRQYEQLDVPDIGEQEIVLEELASMGELTPEMLQALSLDPSAMEDISTDPRLAAAQMAALESLGQISKGGLTEGDMAAIEQARREVDSAQTAREQAILQDMQQRGIGGAGAELALKLASAQGAADRQGAASLDVVRDAQARALQALAAQGDLAGSVRGQDFGEQAQIAAAQDAIRQFNLQNQQRVQDQNVGLRNQAQQMNLGEMQRIAEANAAARNQEEMYNKALIQQQYQNEIQRAGGVAQQYQNMANYQQNKQAQGNAFMGGLIQAGATLGGAYLGGPAGAAAGSAVGKAAADSTTAGGGK